MFNNFINKVHILSLEDAQNDFEYLKITVNNLKWFETTNNRLPIPNCLQNRQPERRQDTKYAQKDNPIKIV